MLYGIQPEGFLLPRKEDEFSRPFASFGESVTKTRWKEGRRDILKGNGGSVIQKPQQQLLCDFLKFMISLLISLVTYYSEEKIVCEKWRWKAEVSTMRPFFTSANKWFLFFFSPILISPRKAHFYIQEKNSYQLSDNRTNEFHSTIVPFP